MDFRRTKVIFCSSWSFCWHAWRSSLGDWKSKQARDVVANVLPLYWLPVFPTQTSSSFGEFVAFLLLPFSYEGDLVRYPSSAIEVAVNEKERNNHNWTRKAHHTLPERGDGKGSWRWRWRHLSPPYRCLHLEWGMEAPLAGTPELGVSISAPPAYPMDSVEDKGSVFVESLITLPNLCPSRRLCCLLWGFSSFKQRLFVCQKDRALFFKSRKVCDYFCIMTCCVTLLHF